MTVNPSYVSSLRQEYDQFYRNGIYEEEPIMVSSHSSLMYDRFVGSEQAITMIGHDILTVEAPGCIAAPTINLVVKNQISIGTKGQNGQHLPARLFVSDVLTITTYYLDVGIIELFKPAALEGAIYCNHLNLYKPIGEPDPAYFEILESFVMREATEIQKIGSTDLISKSDVTLSDDHDFY
jgi:hypothetical protein